MNMKQSADGQPTRTGSYLSSILGGPLGAGIYGGAKGGGTGALRGVGGDLLGTAGGALGGSTIGALAGILLAILTKGRKGSLRMGPTTLGIQNARTMGGALGGGIGAGLGAAAGGGEGTYQALKNAELEPYVQGFMAKCAEAGLPDYVVADLLVKSGAVPYSWISKVMGKVIPTVGKAFKPSTYKALGGAISKATGGAAGRAQMGQGMREGFTDLFRSLRGKSPLYTGNWQGVDPLFRRGYQYGPGALLAGGGATALGLSQLGNDSPWE